MSDLYTKESKSQTLSKMVPMWFYPARQSPASLPEPALKWHCRARAAGAYSPELERPTCRAEGPCPPCPTATPSLPRSQGERGCGGAGERGLKCHPQLCLGRAAAASCSGVCSSSALPTGAQPPRGHGASPASTQARAWSAPTLPLGPPWPC